MMASFPAASRRPAYPKWSRPSASSWVGTFWELVLCSAAVASGASERLAQSWA